MPLTWSGDPCSPGGHIWDGLDCSYSVSDPPGITSVSVSKHNGVAMKVKENHDGQYDEKSVWKCVDIAMKCTSQGSHQRPTMAEVVMQLKERLELETPHDRTENSNMEVSDVSQSSAYVAKMLVAGIGPISKLMLGSLDFTLAALFYSDPKVFEMV
ncbi:hypothetical protein BHE74_00047509 [Ensete ventricosum]|nr:hypothetical protein BHE74_00047509 [Ensete ventricosum]